MKTSIAAATILATAALCAGPALASSPVTIVNCATQAQVRPTALTLFCGDANQSLTRLHWSHWGQASASATAIEVTNDCTPNCAAGRDISKRVRVTVTDLRAGRYHELTVGTTRFALTARGPVIA